MNPRIGKYISIVLLLGLSQGLFSVPAAAADLFLDHFTGGSYGAQPPGWSDESDQPQRDVEIAYDYVDSYAAVTVVVAALEGESLSTPRLNFNVNVYDSLEVDIRLIGSGSVQVGFYSFGPYTEYLGPAIVAPTPGIVTYDIPSLTGLTGDQSLGVVLKINGALGWSLFNSVRIYGPDTPTFTPTVTPTGTPTATHTPTFTHSGTATETPDQTPSFTVTSSPTLTATPTITNTPTVTPTPTESETITLTGTPTETFTNTPSLTESATLTGTPTETPTATWSPTATISATITETSTISPTPTITLTLTISATITETGTPAPTATFTETGTVSPTLTASASITPTLTETPILSPTPTYTVSPVVSATSTGTATPATGGTEALANVRLHAKIFTPNGTMNREMVLGFQSNLAPAEIKISIFTVSGRKLIALSPRNLGAGYEARWDGRDDSGREQPAGIYVYQIKAGARAYRGAVVIAR